MNVSQRGIDLIKRYEGFISHAYLCPADRYTIGWGHIKDVKKGDVVTEAQAENLLKQDLKLFESKLNYSIEQDHVNLNQNQFDACISFIFNLGFSAFIFSTLYKKLKAGDFDGASDEFLKWVYITKTVNGEKVKLRLKGLEQRRKAERDLFLS